MDKNFKPPGYNSVSPYFVIQNGPKFMKLLEDVFEAKELRRYDMPDGTIMHAEMKIDDSVIMLGEASEKYPAVPIVLHVYVSNVDEVFKKAVAAGCEVVEQPNTKKDDPDRRGSFKDFGGNLWSIGTQV